MSSAPVGACASARRGPPGSAAEIRTSPTKNSTKRTRITSSSVQPRGSPCPRAKGGLGGAFAPVKQDDQRRQIKQREECREHHHGNDERAHGDVGRQAREQHHGKRERKERGVAHNALARSRDGPQQRAGGVGVVSQPLPVAAN